MKNKIKSIVKIFCTVLFVTLFCVCTFIILCLINILFVLDIVKKKSELIPEPKIIIFLILSLAVVSLYSYFKNGLKSFFRKVLIRWLIIIEIAIVLSFSTDVILVNSMIRLYDIYKVASIEQSKLCTNNYSFFESNNKIDDIDFKNITNTECFINISDDEIFAAEGEEIDYDENDKKNANTTLTNFINSFGKDFLINICTLKSILKLPENPLVGFYSYVYIWYAYSLGINSILIIMVGLWNIHRTLRIKLSSYSE